MSTPIDGPRLTYTAHAILIAYLEHHGNVLSELHSDALYEVLECFTAYATGNATGRKAFPLATGLGKTSSIVAFIAALDRLGYEVPVAVSASKVEALCTLKRELRMNGVPEDAIGLKHSLTDASEPSTGNDSRLFQLVTHARVRSGNDLELFGNHNGKPRALMIYDETLLRSDSLAVDHTMLRSALGAMFPLMERRKEPTARLAYDYLSECSGLVQVALDSIQTTADTTGMGVKVDMPYRDQAEITAYTKAVGSVGLLGPQMDTLRDLLEISRDSARVLSTSQNRGVVWSSETVPEALRNIVILDASHPIRQLVRLDPTIETAGSFGTIKTWANVEIHQMLAGGGRSTIETSYTGLNNEKSAVSREVIDIVKEQWDTPAAFLIVTFKKRAIDIADILRRDLISMGIDLEAVTPEGKPKINFLCWGSETGLNGLEHCTTVILAGCVQRSHLDIAAAIEGQMQDTDSPLPHKLIKQVLEGEIAHSIFQAASRGSCRRVTRGEAHPMKLYFIHRSIGMKALLDVVMPGATWHYRPTTHLTKGRVEGTVVALAAQLLAHLRGLPETLLKVSSRDVKAALGLAATEAAKCAFIRAREVATEDANSGWTTEGRSFIRWGAAFGATS